ncbi:hypothetical protein [Asaia lannensis]|uniref:hypothetical protein n=1 Tax=Asaia lannensis TaxID=415421 RepID=UPI003872B756
MKRQLAFLALAIFSLITLRPSWAQRAPSPVGPTGAPVAISQAIKWTPEMWIAAFQTFVNTAGGTAADLSLKRPVVSDTSPYLDMVDTSASQNGGRIRFLNASGKLQIGIVDDQGNNFTPIITCARSAMALSGCAFGTSLSSVTTGAGQFDTPQSGAMLGDGSNTLPVPDGVFQSSITVQNSDVVTVNLHAITAPNTISFSQDPVGNASINTNSPSASFNVTAHTITFHGPNNTGTVLNLYGANALDPFVLWQTPTGEAWMKSPNQPLHITAGTAPIILHSVIQVDATTYTVDVTKCGSLSGAKGCFIYHDPSGVATYAPAFQ